MDSQLLTTLQACPRLTDFKFNINLGPKERSNSLETGSLVHVILEAYYKSLLKPEPRGYALDRAFEKGEEYIRLGEDGTGLHATPEESEGWKVGYKNVLQTMRDYFHYYSNDNWCPIAAEEVRGAVIYEDEEMKVLWKAKYDLIADLPNGISSVDHKTMKQRRDTLSLSNQFMGQCVLLNTRSMWVNKIGFQKSLKDSDRFARTQIAYTKNRLDEWINDIVPFYARMFIAYAEAGYFPPNFTHCENKYGMCSFKPVCEVDKGMREEMLMNDYIKLTPWDVKNEPD